MSVVSKNNLEFLGVEYQERLFTQILFDSNFAESIIKVLKPNYFTNEHLKLFANEMNKAYTRENVVLDAGSLQIRLLESVTREDQRATIEAYIDKLKKTSQNDWEYIQHKAFEFCKQQEVLKIIGEMQESIKKNKLDDVLGYEAELQKAFNIGRIESIEPYTFDDIDALLAEDYRNPIPTGITKLDAIMNGGLAEGELAIVLAALGVGKTSIATKIANTAFNLGKNVLQIFFEDSPDAIRRKHLACWTGIEIDKLSLHKEHVKEVVAKKIGNSSGKLYTVKLQSIDTTMATIRGVVRDLKQKGIKIDVMLIDYIDCVQPSRNYSDPLVAEGMIMREYENLLDEFKIAGYAMTQGNRSAIGAKMVDTDQMGGSIKKAQIGHFILSIARPLEQKKEKKATFGILKSRFGEDGIIFDNVIFNNGTLHIEILPNIDGADGFVVPIKHSSDMDSESRIDEIAKKMSEMYNRGKK